MRVHLLLTLSLAAASIVGCNSDSGSETKAQHGKCTNVEAERIAGKGERQSMGSGMNCNETSEESENQANGNIEKNVYDDKGALQTKKELKREPADPNKPRGIEPIARPTFNSPIIDPSTGKAISESDGESGGERGTIGGENNNQPGLKTRF